jgi:hypothetical protein
MVSWKVSWTLLFLSSMNLLIDTMHMSVSILVYIDLASAEKSRALSGIQSFLRSSITLNGFLYMTL